MFIIVVEQKSCPMWILGKADSLEEAVEIVKRNSTNCERLEKSLAGSCSTVVAQFVVDFTIPAVINICEV